jgi:hypothetical protein
MKGLFDATRGRLAAKKKGEGAGGEGKEESKSAGWHRMKSDMANLELPGNVQLVLNDKQDCMNFRVRLTVRGGEARGEQGAVPRGARESG